MDQKSEKRICAVSGEGFDITAEDKLFYEKMGLPLPTFSPEERLKRRMNWRNERNLYKRTCAGTGKSIISCFGEESGVQVYDHDYWWSDAWDPKEYGCDYDFSRPFFTQFRELLENIPMPNLFGSRNVDSPYINHAGEMKNCYMCFGAWGSDNVSHSSKTVNAKDSVDLYWGNESELCYELINAQKCYRSKYLVDCSNITEGLFLFDCHSCSDCFLS